MEDNGHKVLFAVPTNKLAQNNSENGITLNNVFGVGLTEDTKISKFDDSCYDTVVFDEIYFANLAMLSRIKKIR